ncbi:MAG TPA: PIG-L family deacetylase [Thermoanaerobaculia bacterium]|nr:PIG-L family deacetylase [Thermoanaerobaculia bacterium]
MSRRLAPPGRTEEVRADRVLVIAPHYDDETIGCGGLLASLAERGARVVVLFLTDGAGGVEGAPPDVAEAAYAQRRRAEAARALAVLGVGEPRHLELPDGELAVRVSELAARLTEALEVETPDLVLVPGPLESTPDHQAAFAALHEALAPLRAGQPLHESLASTRFLVYEVNHPAYPDLLVDVSDRVQAISAALACYGSQLERHDYAASALGLRAYRTHSLPPAVHAAEGYSRLALSDFTTRGRSDLVAWLGGSPALTPIEQGPLVSVVVRTRDRPELLREALASLAASRYRRLEVLVVNDGGVTPEVGATGELAVRVIDLSENRGRAAAANAGLDAARGEYVAFLDDDDLVGPEHYATLVDLVRAPGVRVAYTDAAVGVYRLEGGAGERGSSERGWVCVERRLPYSRDFDPDVLLVDNYLPLHTLLVERALVERVGPFDESLPFFEDWDWLIRLAQETALHHLARVTCEYRHFERSTHHALGGGDADRGPGFLEVKARVLEKHAALRTPERLASAVVRLRREAVEAVEAAARARADRDALVDQLAEQAAQREDVQRRYFDLERSWHRLNGELTTLRAERDELVGGAAKAAGEIERLRREERRLHGAIAEQGGHLEGTYAEIERLNALIRTMEQTRAWRLHQLLQRRRPAR